ncbi:MAG: tryptophan synthase subunit alpha [Thermoleophilia bacterium]|nr:tryptophan synthase subunit alpha [Thermoleophilia bacterium]
MSDGAARIAAAFPADRAAFIPYVMGGFPDVAASLAHARAIGPHADVLEIGIPYSDPLADGPTIQAAGQRALDAGTRPGDVLEMAEELRGGPPVVLMTYVNLLMAAGPRAFFERAARAGVAGMIVPDLPIDEGDDIRDAAARAGVAMVPLAAPTTTDRRMAMIGRRAAGFTYLVSVAGVTGGELEVGEALRRFVERARRAVDTPLAVGFGIRTPEQAAAIGAFADGVVVASQLIRMIEASPDPRACGPELAAYAERLQDALRAARNVPPGS